MAQWCWVGLGLFCFSVGAAVALLALLAWLVAWLLRSVRRAGQQAYAPPDVPAAECVPVVPAAETPPVVPQEATQAEPEIEAEPSLEDAVLPAPFATYENQRLGRITIHRKGCWAILKKGGGQRHEGGKQLGHESYEAARSYADSTGLNLHVCGICRPETS